jgi:MFS superfamily sulfate permease-like transporter
MNQSTNSSPSAARGEVPRGNAVGFRKYMKFDMVAGFLVFLIALPLCLSISLAYGYPAIAGVFTAVIGGILTAFISDAELTIKGPAAGLIVIAVGCIMDFGGSGVPGDVNMDAYRAALAVGVAAGVIQILFGVFRVGILGEFFPSSVVHGMLAAIGIIIIAKQIPPTLGVSVKGEPLELLGNLPAIISHLNPAIATVGVFSLLVMFAWPIVTKRIAALRMVPAALVILAISIPLSAAVGLPQAHTHALNLEEAIAAKESGAGEATTANHAGPTESADDSEATVEQPDTLVKVPKFGETFSALTFPDFSALAQPKAWKWVLMFSLIGTLESMLSASAMDLIDPYHRKTNLDRDNVAVGIANTLCSLVGAAPMISEIVRSKANLDNGAKTRFANFWHGVFLLAFVALLPALISMIPIAALTAMLIYTGSRLAHPREFKHVFVIGSEQLIIYVTTIVGVLATDLLIGLGIGVLVKIILHLMNGAPLSSMFRPYLDVEEISDNHLMLHAKRSAVFSNWIPFRRQIENVRREGKNLTVDLSGTILVDHTVMSKLAALQQEFEANGLQMTIIGLENHHALSLDSHAARKRPEELPSEAHSDSSCSATSAH